jgi:hypothetical protein
METPQLKCEVCGGQAKGVCSSTIGAYSAAYCQECLNRHAEMYWGFIYLYYMVGTRGDGLSDWVKQLTTYRDGHYITWSQFDSLQREYNFLEEPQEQF